MNAERKEELKNLIARHDEIGKTNAWLIVGTDEEKEYYRTTEKIIELTKELLAEPLTPNERSLIWEEENKKVALSSAEYWLEDYLSAERYENDKERKFLEASRTSRRKKLPRSLPTTGTTAKAPLMTRTNGRKSLANTLRTTLTIGRKRRTNNDLRIFESVNGTAGLG